MNFNLKTKKNPDIPENDTKRTVREDRTDRSA